MCGIFGYVGEKTNAASLILNGLKSLEYRGYDSWGVAVVPTANSKLEERIYIKKKAGKIGEANVSELPESSFGFGHTRWATHGGVTDINSHPHLDCSGTIAVIHNGIIENYDLLKKELLLKKHRFVSQTDSEVAVHLIEEYAKKNNFVEAVRKAFIRFSGLNAIIAINTSNNSLVAIRNGSPLVIGLGKEENLLSSDPSALIPFTKIVYFLKDWEMAVVTKNNVEIKEVKNGQKKSFTPIKLEWDTSLAEKGKYETFMLKEIYEQPKILENIVKNSEITINFANNIKKSYGTYMIGCGSASYACIAGAYLFSKIAKRHINWAVASEFSYHLDFLTPKSLVIALSQSGETMDIIEAIKKAKLKDVKIAAFTNVLGSTLYREADYKILIGAGIEKGVASTKALTAKLTHLILLAFAIIDNPKRGKEILKKAVKSSKILLEEKSISNINKLVKIIKNKRHIYVIGRGLSYPASLETALKIKEISYIHAEGMAAGELKHGPLSLVEKGTPCIAFLPNDETYGANLAGAMEMKARGGYLIGVSYKNHEIFDYFIEVKDCSEATIIPNIIFGQLLGYFLTTAKGLDPDKPRNLAKSVTVK